MRRAGEVRIDYLAYHIGLAPLLANWHYQEWQSLLPDWSLAEAIADLQSHTGRRQIPTTFVAIDDGRPIGSASLLTSDLAGWDHLSPWLASVYVVPELRGQGIGKQLVIHATQEAERLGIPALYLFTAGQQSFYERLGWSLLERTKHFGRDVVIMQFALKSQGGDASNLAMRPRPR